jgi:predicted AAA+ superfamily ATPase
MELYSIISGIIMIKRTLHDTIIKTSQTFPALMLTGPRQVGKTTLLEMCAEEGRSYVSLDDYDARYLAKTDPALFLEIHPFPLIIDEIQYAPQLFSQLKIMIDRHKKNGMYWLTGSQKFSLMTQVSDSLAGRIGILELNGLSQSEIEDKSQHSKPFIPTLDLIKKTLLNDVKTTDGLYHRIWIGSFPRLYSTDTPDRDLFYKSYIQTYIQRDVKDLLSISDDSIFYRFISLLAARTAQILNLTDLARDTGIDTKTAKSWLSILETSGLVYILRPYHNNLSKRLVKTPKLYFLDTGLCSYLTRWPTPESLENGIMSGAMLETYLISEILKSYWYNGKEAFIYYYRDIEQREIDLIIDEGGKLFPIEFKRSATPSLTNIKNFAALNQLGTEIGLGAIVCLTQKPIPLSREIIALSVAQI